MEDNHLNQIKTTTIMCAKAEKKRTNNNRIGANIKFKSQVEYNTTAGGN